jgi:hypothetical protein
MNGFRCGQVCAPAGGEGVEEQCAVGGCGYYEVEIGRKREAGDRVLVPVQHVARRLPQRQAAGRGPSLAHARPQPARPGDAHNVPDNHRRVLAACRAQVKHLLTGARSAVRSFNPFGLGILNLSACDLGSMRSCTLTHVSYVSTPYCTSLLIDEVNSLAVE